MSSCLAISNILQMDAPELTQQQREKLDWRRLHVDFLRKFNYFHNS